MIAELDAVQLTASEKKASVL